MWLSVVVKYLCLSWRVFLANLTSAMSFRMSFWINIMGATFFFAGHFCLWIIFFQQFSSIDGWTISNVSLANAIFLLSYSLIDVFAGGVMELARIIAAGNLDYFLVFPKPILWHVAVSRSDMSSIGALFLSVGMFFYSGDITFLKTGAFFLASCFSTILLFNFLVITQSAAFFMGNIEHAALEARYLMATVVYYPHNIFPGPLRLILMTVLPSFFVVVMPANLVESFSLTTVVILSGACVISSLLAYVAFKQGLKRYESGNLVSVRM